MAPHRPNPTQDRSRQTASFRNPLVASEMPTPTPTSMEIPDTGEPLTRCREDDELTSLTWLQDRNLLKSIRVGSGNDDDDSSQAASSADDLADESSDGAPDTLSAPAGPASAGGLHVPYNPKLHVTAKPPYSFSCLIFMAVEEAPAKALPVKDIYAWILTHFPYFQNAPTGWKNSVRHNLSLNKCFRKVDKDKGQNIGKGSLWCIDPDYRPNLLQALRKTPYHPYHQLQMLAAQSPQHTQLAPKPLPLAPRLNVNIPNPELFPYLSKRLAASSIKDPEVDAAATMLALKDGTHVFQDYDADYFSRNENGRGDKRNRRFRNRFRTCTPGYLHKLPASPDPVITTSPSEDHTYSSCPDVDQDARSASPSTTDEASEATDDDDGIASGHDDADEELEEDWENVPSRGNAYDDEERKKIVEGADALLNLAGIKTNLARRANRRAVNGDSARR